MDIEPCDLQPCLDGDDCEMCGHPCEFCGTPWDYGLSSWGQLIHSISHGQDCSYMAETRMRWALERVSPGLMQARNFEMYAPRPL